jgi:hypothetical protein
MAAPSSTPPPPAGAGVTGGSAGSWSDRFEQGLHPAIERFNASIGFDIALWRSLRGGGRWVDRGSGIGAR